MAMKNGAKYWARKSHRWLGLLIGLQLLLWTVSGLYFSIMPIEAVRGEDRIRETEAANFAFTPLASPAAAIAQLVQKSGPSVQVRSVLLRRLADQPVYEIRYALQGEDRIILANAGNGDLLPPLNREQAILVAQQDFVLDAPISSVEYIEQVAADAEYRERPLPAWRISFDEPGGTRLYVAAELGKVTARRNDTWRVFDFMWMLHIMDFESRDNFNTLLLQLLAGLAIISIVSGFILWGMTTSLFGSRQSSPEGGD